MCSVNFSISSLTDTIFKHQALCDEAVAGMSWIFFTTPLIAIFSMLSLMFRSALYPIKDFALPASSSDENGIEVVNESHKVVEIATENIAQSDANPPVMCLQMMSTNLSMSKDFHMMIVLTLRRNKSEIFEYLQRLTRRLRNNPGIKTLTDI